MDLRGQGYPVGNDLLYVVLPIPPTLNGSLPAEEMKTQVLGLKERSEVRSRRSALALVNTLLTLAVALSNTLLAFALLTIS